jgi:hypothetical protein
MGLRNHGAPDQPRQGCLPLRVGPEISAVTSTAVVVGVLELAHHTAPAAFVVAEKILGPGLPTARWPPQRIGRDDDDKACRQHEEVVKASASA